MTQKFKSISAFQMQMIKGGDSSTSTSIIDNGDPLDATKPPKNKGVIKGNITIINGPL